MEITIKATPKEMAAILCALQGQAYEGSEEVKVVCNENNAIKAEEIDILAMEKRRIRDISKRCTLI
ncbi:hypothetical protein [Eubacterium aggregans]|uniref:hypothetical protein n=1 Tax=Eubacterium aggregans TaxID=81409 RepID=UPI003F2DEF7C